VLPALDGAVVDRVHVDRPRQRGRGDCGASFSNLIGIVLTPVLVTVFIVNGSGGCVPRLDPGHPAAAAGPVRRRPVLRRWLTGLFTRHKKVLGYVDRGSILLVVYAAFSEGVVAGIWGRLSIANLGLLLAVNAALLAFVLVSTTVLARPLGFAGPTRSPSCSAARRSPWPAGCRWPACCSRPARSAWSCCR